MMRPIAVELGNRLFTWTLRATIVHLFVALLPLVVPWLYGPAGAGPVISDVSIYFGYASRVMAGAVPYRDFAVEYPPLALPLFLLPRLLTRWFGLYFGVFGLQMLAFDAVTVYLVARWVAGQEGLSQVPARLGWYTLYIATLYPFIVARYDLAPTAIAFLATLWWFSNREGWGGAAAAFGGLLKIFPACIAGPAILWELSRVRTRGLRGAAAFALTLAAGGGTWWVLGGARTLQYHVGRGLGIESIPAGLLMVLHAVGITRGELQLDYNHGSYALVAPGAQELAMLALPAQGVAFLLVLWRFWRARFDDPLRYAGAAVLAFVATGKTLSPQYLIWLIPFVTVLAGQFGHRARWLFLLSCLATTLVYPWGVYSLLAFDPLAIGLLDVRNALLLGLLAHSLFGRNVPTSTHPQRAGTR